MITHLRAELPIQCQNPNCNKVIEPDSKFCPYCGTRVEFGNLRIYSDNITSFKFEKDDKYYNLPYLRNIQVGYYKLLFHCNGIFHKKNVQVSKNQTVDIILNCESDGYNHQSGHVFIYCKDDSAKSIINTRGFHLNQLLSFQNNSLLSIHFISTTSDSIDTIMTINKDTLYFFEVGFDTLKDNDSSYCKKPTYPSLLDTTYSPNNRVLGPSLVIAGIGLILYPVLIETTNSDSKSIRTEHKIMLSIGLPSLITGSWITAKNSNQETERNKLLNLRKLQKYNYDLEEFYKCKSNQNEKIKSNSFHFKLTKHYIN